MRREALRRVGSLTGRLVRSSVPLMTLLSPSKVAALKHRELVASILAARSR
jgi:hypothetical protein